MKYLLVLWIPATMLLVSCAPEPRAIDYGSDMCHYCKMTIVDQQHAAELVTTRGKVHTFDAIECLVQYLEEPDQLQYSWLVVNDYLNPATLIEAQSASYLISKAIPSPMGAFLSAFSNPADAIQMSEAKGGEVFDWPGLLTRFNSKKEQTAMTGSETN